MLPEGLGCVLALPSTRDVVTVSKAKLTDAENFDGSGTVHIGSGINNAVLRAVALFEALLSGVF